MKRIISIFICLVALVSVVMAEEEVKPSDKEAYNNMEDEYTRSVIIENEKIAEYVIRIPDGFKTFYDKDAEDVLFWEDTDENGNVQTGNDGKYTYMSKKRIDAGGKIELVYDVLYDSIRVYYTCSYSIFDVGKATHAVNKIIQDFEILKEFETEDGQIVEKPRYYGWEYYYGNDKFGKETSVKPYKDKETKKKYTEYYAHIKFKKR